MFDDEMVHLNMNCKKTLEYKYWYFFITFMDKIWESFNS